MLGGTALLLSRNRQILGLRGEHQWGGGAETRAAGSVMSARRDSGKTCGRWGSQLKRGVPGTPSLLHVCPSYLPYHVSL